MFSPDPGCRFLPIPDPGSEKQQQKRGAKKKFVVIPFFVATNFTKFNYFIFEMLKKKNWANFQRIIELFTQNIVTRVSKIWVWDPDPQHCSGCNEIISAYAQPALKSFPRMLSMDLHVKSVNTLPLAEHARKFFQRRFIVRQNCFLLCSVCDKIISTYAQHRHAITFKNYSKIPS